MNTIAFEQSRFEIKIIFSYSVITAPDKSINHIKIPEVTYC